MILVIDNYDSFTYNLVQYLGQCGAECVVKRNNEVTLGEIEALRPDGVMLSPGPCRPTESGVCLDVVQAALTQTSALYGTPLFGVCLGHQAIGYVGSGTVERAPNVMHGKTSQIEHDGKGLFSGVPNPMTACRYHSLVVRPDAVPAGFVVTAWSMDDRQVMGVRHESLPIEGVQFHPESILTEGGIKIVENFAAMTRTA